MPETGALTLRYTALLHRVVFTDDPLVIETALAEAADLGRELVHQGVAIEEVAELHQNALIDLSRTAPDLPLNRIAGQITTPLMEAYMAYSLAFREQVERRAEAIVNARLEQSRRLEAIGTLAAGIAHDFNNILGAIVGFTELLSDDVPADSPGQQHVQRVLQASFRARDLVARLLTFARQVSDDPIPVEVVTLVRETVDLLCASLLAGIRLEYSTDLTETWVLAEPSQIQQIVMNLCINAADAMPNAQGVITVTLHWVPPPLLLQTNHAPVLLLCVRDNGEGMTPEVQRQVFDPFFTTKAPGKGSGLGLSVIHGLVGKLGGIIELDSTLGVGSRFSVYLPLLDPALRPVTAVAVQAAQGSA